jgi:hypothetical protein
MVNPLLVGVMVDVEVVSAGALATTDKAKRSEGVILFRIRKDIFAIIFMSRDPRNNAPAAIKGNVARPTSKLRSQ